MTTQPNTLTISILWDKLINAKCNVSDTERTIRISLAVICTLICLAGLVGGLFAVLLMIRAAVLLVTGVLGLCPFYALYYSRIKPAIRRWKERRAA